MNIALINTGSSQNLGDRAILLNVVTALRTQENVKSIYVSHHFPQTLVEEYQLNTYPMFYTCLSRYNVIASKLSVPRLMSALLFMLYVVVVSMALAAFAVIYRISSISLPGNSMEISMLRSLRSVDLVIFTGGGYLTDLGRFECRSVLYMGVLAHLMGKKIVISGVGLGPFDSYLTKKLLAYVFRTSASMSVRDPESSKKVLIDLGVDISKLKIRPDDALCLQTTARAGIKKSEKILAIQYRRSKFIESGESLDTEIKRYIKEMNESGWRIRFFVFAKQYSWEVSLINEIMRELNIDEYDVVDEEDPRIVKGEVSKCSLAIGFAYHFAIFALSAGVPAISFYGGRYYQDKMLGIYSWFNRMEWCIRQEDADVKVLLMKTNELMRKREEESRYLKLKASEYCRSNSMEHELAKYVRFAE